PSYNKCYLYLGLQLILPSVQYPFLQVAPALLNSIGLISLHCLSISLAKFLISHCALLQHLFSKKCNKVLTFIVNTILVSQALGNTYLASSIAFLLALLLSIPSSRYSISSNLDIFLYAISTSCIASSYSLLNISFLLILGGVIYSKVSSKFTYLCDC